MAESRCVACGDPARPTSIESAIADAVRAAVADVVADRGPDPRAVSTKTAAAMLGCGQDHVRHLVTEGKLAKLPDLGHKVLIPVQSIDRYVAEAADVQPLRAVG